MQGTGSCQIPRRKLHLSSAWSPVICLPYRKHGWLFGFFLRGATHQPTTYKAAQRTVVKPMLSPCTKTKGHFPAALLQVWRGWVGSGDAGSLPRMLTKGTIASPSQVSVPYRTCPISNPNNIFTVLLLQGCEGGQWTRQSHTHPLARSCLFAPSPALTAAAFHGDG